MNPNKKTYLKRIRRESSYSTFRLFVDFGSGLLYFVGVLLIGGGILASIFLVPTVIHVPQDDAVGVSVSIVIITVPLGVLCIIVGKLFREAFLMLTDIADSVTDIHSRYEQ